MANRHDPSREIVSLGCAENLVLQDAEKSDSPANRGKMIRNIIFVV